MQTLPKQPGLDEDHPRNLKQLLARWQTNAKFMNCVTEWRLLPAIQTQLTRRTLQSMGGYPTLRYRLPGRYGAG